MHTPAPIELMNVCLLRDDANRMLVQDRTDPSWPVLCFPGGHVEIGETCVDAVVREMQEETGLTVEPMRMSAIFERVNEGREGTGSRKMYFVFLCRYLEDVPQKEAVERDAYQTGMEWMTIEKAKKADLFPRVIRENLSSLIGYGETIYLGSERRGG